ncbi:MAG TPA: AtpZ/AtpI family protein [Terracidiphilus sp.]|nr:AtpZ/AtpI family protein [Terracidiphilus sp.]
MPYQRPIPETKKPGKTTPGLRAVVEAEKMIQIAIMLPVTAIVGWLAGAWLDKRLHQSWIGFAGILLGGVGGLIYVIRLALAAEKTGERTADPSADKPADQQAASRDEGRGKTE